MRACGVGGDDGVAVHRRARERRHVERRGDVGGGHAAGGLVEGDALGARDGHDGGAQPAPRFVERDGRCEWTHQ